MADESRHERHDREVVAEAVDRGGPARLAQALLAACTDCARLYADLQALAVALPATATPSRPRDFTLTAADADRLRSRGVRAWLGLIGSARDTITRPLAIGLTTLGLAGLLVATVPGALPSSGSAILSTVGAPVGGAAASAETQELQPSAAAAAPEATLDDDVFSGSDSGDPAPTTLRQSAGDGATAVEAPPPPDAGLDATLLTAAGLLTVAGLGLFALRWSARTLGRR